MGRSLPFYNRFDQTCQLAGEHGVAILGLLLLGGFYHWLLGGTGLADWGGDNASYLLLADAWRGDAFAAKASAGFHFPPLFPLLIALAGGGSQDPAAAHAVVIASLLGTLAVLWFGWRHLLPRPARFAAMLVLAALPGVWWNSLDILSENTFTLFVLLTLALAERARHSRRRLAWLWVALAMAAATLTRSAGIALSGGMLLYLLQHRRTLTPWAWLAVMLPALSMALPLLLRTQATAPSYFDHLLRAYDATPWQALQNQLALGLPSLARGWVQLLDPYGGRAAIWPALLLALLALIGAGQRWREGGVEAAFLVAYLAMLAVWPFPAEASRLLYALLPLALILAAQAVLQTGRRWPRYRSGGLVVTIGVLSLGLAGPCSRFLAHQWLEWPVELRPYRHARMVLLAGHADARIAAARNFRDLQTAATMMARDIPADDCVFSVKPPVIMLLARRISHLPPLPTAQATAFASDMLRCRYAYLLPFATPTFGEPLYPASRLDDRAQPVHTFDTPGDRPGEVNLQGILVRLR